jgi:hypothetical protein
MHFQLMAVLPSDVDDDILSALRLMLAPYNVDRAVTPHEERCHCVGRAAMAASQEAAGKSLGKGETEEDIDRFQFALATAFSGHPRRDEATPACSDCLGSGRRTTTRNPLSYWSSLAIAKPLAKAATTSGPRTTGREVLATWQSLPRLPFAIWSRQDGWKDRWGGQGIHGGYLYIPEEPWRTVSRRALAQHLVSEMVLLDCHL